MPTDGSFRSSAAWPAAKFVFEVRCESAVMHFQEVSGLDTDTQVIEYRSGNRPSFDVMTMPGIRKVGEVTLKRGVIRGDARLWDWINHPAAGTIQRKPLTISLLDERGTTTMVWTLTNAWPSKVSSTGVKAPGHDVAMEAMVIEHEGMTINQA